MITKTFEHEAAHSNRKTCPKIINYIAVLKYSTQVSRKLRQLRGIPPKSNYMFNKMEGSGPHNSTGPKTFRSDRGDFLFTISF